MKKICTKSWRPSGATVALMVVAILLIGLGAAAPLESQSKPKRSTPRYYIQPYDLYDWRYCHLTPRPFICERCLRAGLRFARRLSFERDGRPVRYYGCYRG